MRKYSFWTLVSIMFVITNYIVFVVPSHIPDMNTNHVILLGILGLLGYLNTFLLLFAWREGYIKR